ncbi:MAG: hypothetical protein ACPGES_12755, partial [Coraliomargarita sp.]
GLAVMLYEATLVSDQTPFDAWLAGDEDALSPEAENGMDAFYSGGLKCGHCHSGPLLSAATWDQLLGTSMSCAAIPFSCRHRQCDDVLNRNLPLLRIVFSNLDRAFVVRVRQDHHPLGFISTQNKWQHPKEEHNESLVKFHT